MQLIITGVTMKNKVVLAVLCGAISVLLEPSDAIETEANEETCKLLTDAILLKPGQLPKTALASFQGSGNTWVRQILASSTGYKTGDSYGSSYGNDVYPEFSSKCDDTVIASKTHSFSSPVSSTYKRALVIIRHPLDALFAEFNRVYGGNKTGYADIHHVLNKDGSTTWEWDVWMTHITSWIDFHRHWLNEFKGDVHIIYYNNLKERPLQELYSTIKFLQLEPDNYRINCTLYHPKPAYFRRKHSKSPTDKYTIFRLFMSKASQAIHILKELIANRFSRDSVLYTNFNLDISEPRLR